MASTKTERLLQIVLCLSQGQRPITRAQLRRAIPDYSACPSDEAFERMFERDKNELRELGIPLETSGDPGDEDAGYRIDRTAYALPDLRLTRDEMVAMALAARVWQEQGPASAAARALLKLSAEGIDVDPIDLPAIEPRLAGGEAAFGPLTTAVSGRQQVQFSYRAARETAPMIRHLQPWGVVSRRGRWYVVGHDLDRSAVRVFRLTRIEAEVTIVGEPGAYEVPADVDLRSHVDVFAAAGPQTDAVLLVQPGAGYGLRRRASSVVVAEQRGGQVAEHVAGQGWDRVTVPSTGAYAFAEEVASYGPVVLVESPAELRTAVIECLQGVLARQRREPGDGQR